MGKEFGYVNAELFGRFEKIVGEGCKIVGFENYMSTDCGGFDVVKQEDKNDKEHDKKNLDVVYEHAPKLSFDEYKSIDDLQHPHLLNHYVSWVLQVSELMQ